MNLEKIVENLKTLHGDTEFNFNPDELSQDFQQEAAASYLKDFDDATGNMLISPNLDDARDAIEAAAQNGLTIEFFLDYLSTAIECLENEL